MPSEELARDIAELGPAHRTILEASSEGTNRRVGELRTPQAELPREFAMSHMTPVDATAP